MYRETYSTHSLVIDSHGELSPKEELEAAAICFGRSTKESARARGVSPETAKCQRANAKAKVGAATQCEFIITLLERGWLTLEGDLTRFRLLFELSATLRPLPASPLEIEFHRAQPRVKSNPQCIRTSACAAVEPLFCRPAPGEGAFYDVPAYLRKRMQTFDVAFENRVRITAYTDRLRHFIDQAA